jgi:dTDP-4-dehydrorhamnose 3,5-epimerase-like enzyme
MKAITDTAFQAIPGETRSQIVNHINPAHLDSRGGFEQILPFGEKYDLTYSTKWVKQINHSWSVPMVFRGFHAQKGKKCQGKLVENAGLKEMMYDVVIDARPESNTCGSFKVYPLLPIDSPNHNLLFVPRGFLHGMMSSPTEGTVSHLQYYVDAPYSKKDEITVSPRGLLDYIAKNVMETSTEAMWSLLKPFVDAVAKGGLELSEKDIVGVPIDKFLEQEKRNYTKKGKSWWRK